MSSQQTSFEIPSLNPGPPGVIEQCKDGGYDEACPWLVTQHSTVTRGQSSTVGRSFDVTASLFIIVKRSVIRRSYLIKMTKERFKLNASKYGLFKKNADNKEIQLVSEPECYLGMVHMLFGVCFFFV